MKKHLGLLLIIPILSTCISCGNTTSSSSYTPETDLERVFEKLTNNNFTLDYTDSLLDLQNKERHQKYYYTEYSCQTEGDLSSGGIAQGDDVVFRYNIVDGEVVSGTPLVNYSTGIRYDSIYSYTYGLQSFDISKLPKTKNSDGYYVYEYGKNFSNDITFMAVFLGQGYSGYYPDETKIKVVKDTLIIETLLMTYTWDDGTEFGRNTINTVVYDIGKTENTEIKQYLQDGKTSKQPLDLRFFKLIQPYLYSTNYTCDIDSMGMIDPSYRLKMTSKYTEKATAETFDGDSYSSGYVVYDGIVSSYNIINEKVVISDTPSSDGSSFYSSIYGQIIAYDFTSLTYDLFLGYIDEEHENSYYLTDNQLLNYLAYMCYIPFTEEMMCDRVRIEIIDDETHSFNLYFELHNTLTNTYLGLFKAKYYNLNNTSIPEVDRYLKRGDLPSTQSKETLNEVLSLFKKGNYSMDSNTGAGLAKYYFTENYFYEELYQNPANNIGYIKEGNAIYKFNIVDGVVTVNRNQNFAEGSSPMTLPGCGTMYLVTDDDLGYLSHFDDALYNVDNYKVSSLIGEEVWEITDLELSQNLFTYFYGDIDVILPLGTGLIVSKGEDSYDTRVTFMSAFRASDGSFDNAYYFTYYDIGNTSHAIIDEYLANI